MAKDKVTGAETRRAPHPERGWSREMRCVAPALVVPAFEQDMVQPAGVFDAKGDYVHEAVLWRSRALMVEPSRPAPVEHLAGRWLWGGVLLNHFGHFLVETLGRLWGLDAGPADGVVFLSKRDAEEEGDLVELSEFHRRFFGLLGIDLPIRILTRPTEVEVLHVPGQGFGIGAIAAGTPEFRAYIHRHFAMNIAPEGPEDLYISRSGLSAARGGVLQEERIEALLAAQGYAIFHPQRHPIEVQIATYKAARRVVALDGSALHLFAMVARPDQRVAVIKRRDSGASDSILAHLSAFSGRVPEVIDVIKQDWVRSDRKRADRTSVGELDFVALAQALAERGFLDEILRVSNLTERQAQRAITQMERDLGRGKLTFRPVPRGVDPASVPITEHILTERQRARKAEQAARKSVEEP